MFRLWHQRFQDLVELLERLGPDDGLVFVHEEARSRLNPEFIPPLLYATDDEIEQLFVRHAGFEIFLGDAAHASDAGKRLRGHGTPEEVAEDMAIYRDEADVQNFQVNFNGCPSLGQLVESMHCFVEQVIPKLD